MAKLDEILEKKDTSSETSDIDTPDLNTKRVSAETVIEYIDPLDTEYVITRNNLRGGPIWYDPRAEVFRQIVIKKDF